MSIDSAASPLAERDDPVGLIAAVAAGELDRHDAVAILRRSNLDALDVLVQLLADQARLSSLPARGRRMDVQAFSTAPTVDAPRPTHRVPALPFVLRGTLYDPQDINRFDGIELHLIVAGPELVAIDDRQLMDRWWQNSYLTSAATAGANNAFLKGDTDSTTIPVIPIDTGRPGGHMGVVPTSIVPPIAPPPIGPCVLVPTPAPVEHTNFYEHEDNRGDRLELHASAGAIADLTDEHLGGLFSGHDWNDKISAVELVRTEVAVLYEHTNFTGNSLTLTGNARALWPFGWNDQASAVRTWGSTPWTQLAWYCGPWG